jgi:hypothetical protein
VIIQRAKVTKSSIKQLLKLTSSIDIPVSGRKIVKTMRFTIAERMTRRIFRYEVLKTA